MPDPIVAAASWGLSATRAVTIPARLVIDWMTAFYDLSKEGTLLARDGVSPVGGLLT
jgi:hypothetical protein